MRKAYIVASKNRKYPAGREKVDEPMRAFLSTIVVGLAISFSGSGTQAAPIHDAAKDGDTELVDSLIAAGVAVDDANELGETPLFVAAKNGHYALVEKLALMHKANVKARDLHGMTAVHAAVLGENIEAIGLIVSMGINMNDAENDRGVSPLMVAVEQNDIPIARFLADHGARLEQTNLDGFTPLTVAGHLAFEDMILMLIRFGGRCQEVDPAWFATCTERMSALGIKPI